MIKVLLVDDHEIVRYGLKRIIDDIKGFSVIGVASSGEDALEFCRGSETPDVVLMDMNMPGIGGLEATKKVLRAHEDVKVIILTAHTEAPFPAKMMQIGAHGYLTKDTPPNELVDAIRKVKSGQRYIAADIAQQVALGQINMREDSPFDQLSERELQIMMMITKGSKVQNISEQLALSSKTINTYRYRMFEKLKVQNDVELTHLAIRYGLIDSETL